MQLFKKSEPERKKNGAGGPALDGMEDAPDVSGTLDEINALLNEKTQERVPLRRPSICGCFGSGK